VFDIVLHERGSRQILYPSQNLCAAPRIVVRDDLWTTFEVRLDPDGSGTFSVEEGEVVFDEYDSDKEWDITAGRTLKFENFAVSGLD
jgi:hypothetical protein